MKYIFLDVDGTLIDSFDYAIPQSANEAIILAKNNGHKVFVCTGRPLSQVKKLNLNLFDGVICSAGAYVEKNNTVVFQRIMNNDEIKQIVNTLHKYNLNYILEGKYSNYYLENGVDDFMSMFRMYDPNMSWDEMVSNLCLSSMSDLKDDSVFKITFYTNKKAIIQQVEEELKDNYQMIYTEHDEGQMMEIEIMFNDCNKAEGIKKLIEHDNILLSDTIGIGDSMNDYEMIQECGIGIAMGNACEQLKSISNMITDSVSDDGIYKAFKKLELI
jgi:Cof subfamily protein (haloacid dehalogenase superfamily)